jgi:hypothetical protein
MDSLPWIVQYSRQVIVKDRNEALALIESGNVALHSRLVQLLGINPSHHGYMNTAWMMNIIHD